MGTFVDIMPMALRRASLWTRTLAFLALWRRRARERRELVQMSEVERHDIGLTCVDVWREVNKPFWRV
jgi:uncharacterized protein YjiS (DUF1127 family)